MRPLLTVPAQWGKRRLCDALLPYTQDNTEDVAARDFPTPAEAGMSNLPLVYIY